MSREADRTKTGHCVCSSLPGRSPVSTKRRRVAITAGDKRDICKWKRDNPQASLGNLLSWIQNSLGMDVPKSTLSDILREAPKWLEVTVEKEHLTRARCGEQTRLEAALVEWLSEVGTKGGEISDLALVEKARVLGGSLGIPSDFGYSRGWLHRFKMRQGLARMRNLLGLASFPPLLSDPSTEQVRAVAKWNELRKLLAKYDPEDVYSLGETGLFYQLAPSETDFTGPADAQGHPRLTLVLVCNATGRNKVTPLVLCGTSKRVSFGGCFTPSLYCDYRSTPGGVMSPQVFRDVAKRLDRALRLQGRQAVLLVDRSAPHSTTAPGLTNLAVHYLPPNSVALQPLETGIFMSVKAYYRRDLVRHYVANAAEGRPLAVTLRRALQMVGHAWSSVSPRTIRKCWLHTGILSELAAQHDGDDILDRAEDDIPLIELQQLIGRLNGCGGVSAADYVTIDDDLQTSMRWEPAPATSDSGEVEDDGEEVADVGAVPSLTLREAVEGVNVAIAFLEQLGEAEHLGSLWTVLRTLEGKYLRRPKRLTSSPSAAPQVQTSFGSGLSCDRQGLRERV